MAGGPRLWSGAQGGADRGVDDDRIQDGLPALGAGTDPASLPLTEMPKQIVVSARMLEAHKNGKPGANGSNGHTNGSNGTR